MIQQSHPGHASVEKHGPKGFMHPGVHCNTVYNRQDMEAQPKCPLTEEWIKRIWHVYTMECY